MKELWHAVGQTLWIGFEGTEVSDRLRRRIARGEAGAAVLFARNIPSGSDGADPRALRHLCDELHRAAGEAPAPLLIAVDQEGGRVQRVREPATRWPPMLSFERVEENRVDAFAEAVGRGLGAELFALGFDVDFAPVLDVHTNPENPIIGDRAFGTEPERAATRALAFARGLQQAGVLACGKHFPGHGDTRTDSHLELPRLDHDLDRLREVELLPFARAAALGLPMMMTAHVVFAALDPSVPATLSRRVVTDLLRKELGFRGAVVSDDLDMKAIAGQFGIGDAAVEAILAGCDALLLCRDQDHQEEAREALIRAAEGSPIVRDRVREAAAAVGTLKKGHTRNPMPRPDPVGVLGLHEYLADELARGEAPGPEAQGR